MRNRHSTCRMQMTLLKVRMELMAWSMIDSLVLILCVLTGIVQRKHNQKALQSLEVPLVPSPEELLKYRKTGNFEPNVQVMRRKHKTAVLQGLRSEHLKMDMPNLIKKANELHVPLIDKKSRKKLKKNKSSQLYYRIGV